MRVFSFFGLLALLATAACALPTLQGPTGLATIPTADVADIKAVDIALDYLNTNHAASGDALPLRAEVNLCENYEAGLAVTPLVNHSTVNVNAKWLSPIALADLRLALGGQVAFGRKYAGVSTQFFDVYLVGTREFVVIPEKFNITPTLGLDLLKAKGTLVNGAAYDGTAFRPFAGLKFQCMKLNNTSFNVDYTPKSTKIGQPKALVSYLFRVPVTDRFTAELGLTNLYAVTKTRPFLGVNYRFGIGE